MKKQFLLIPLLLASMSSMAEEREINTHWKFQSGDFPEAKYANFDDAPWREVHLPHDWAFENGFSANGPQRDKGGYASGGIGWYRKEFTLTKEETQAKKVFVDFDAAYMNSEVWVNGTYLGKRPYGYISFSYDITKHLKPGNNVLSVRIDNSLEPSARWYHGCGIYGNVYLRTHGECYFEKDATFIHTANSKGEVGVKSVFKSAENNKALRTYVEILDAQGVVKAHSTSSKVLTANGEGCTEMKLRVRKPLLWSPETPNLYTMRFKLLDKDNNEVDTQDIRFGFRDLGWTAENGFFLNGKQYKLRGVCEHLEGGPTGAIYTEQLLRWKLQLLKDMGCNAVRTAHNPQIPCFYDICDEMGILVMDELFDGWLRKADFDYGMQAFDQWWEKDLRSFIRRDRNHPCVFLYSMGNETRGDIAPKLVEACHEEDPTRLVTSGSANSNDMDVIGMNGGSETDGYIESYVPKDKPFIATENPHTWQVRGYYRTQTWYRDGFRKGPKCPQVIPNLTEKEIFTYDWTSPEKRRNVKQIFNSSYDNATVRTTARRIMEFLRDKNWFSGSFRWTGFDYLGEAGYVHGGWPFRAFQSGALDLAGFPKDLYYLYQSEWSSKDMVHILPHWTHPTLTKGTIVPIWVYTTGDEVELLFNGKSLGRKSKGTKWDEMQCQFDVPYEEGTLEAIGYRDGKVIARNTQRTAGAPTQLGISIENPKLKADYKDVSILTIRQEDNNGTLYPYGENRIHAYITGAAKVLSFESGSPVDTECNYNAASKRCFFGLNRIFVQSTDNKCCQPVSILLASINGDKKLMQSDKVTITCYEKALRGELPVRNLKVYYTTDGSQPCTKSKLYTGAFTITPETTVKVVVYDGEKELIQMKETFGPEEGLYWGKVGEPICAFNGEQAERVQLIDCQKQSKGEGFYAEGFVLPKPGKGQINWYQENDGEKMGAELAIRYSQDNKGAETVMALYNNDQLVKEITFPDTGSKANNWKEIIVPLELKSGANNLSLRSVSKETSPNIDQMRIITSK